MAKTFPTGQQAFTKRAYIPTGNIPSACMFSDRIKRYTFNQGKADGGGRLKTR
jgi:hypothetical protein